MESTLQLTHERVDDVPLLLGFLIMLRFPQILGHHLKPHPHHQGLSQGWLITLWITYILSQADHRKSHVRDWANSLHQTLEAVTGQTIREVDFSDDRLTLVLQPLSNPETWDHIETELWDGTCEVYALPLERVRLDSTTSYGFHTVVAGGLMQLGHSKDHRPDLPQFKLMAAAAEPTGQLITATVHPGDAADDPLYLPIIERVRALLGRTGLLYTGDCKMAALETRVAIVARGDFYLTPLPMTGATKDQFTTTWVEDAVRGARRAELVPIRIGEDQVGMGYEFDRNQTARVDGVERTWSERAQVIRSDSLAETQARALQRRLEKAEVAVRALTPPPGPGRVQFTMGWELERAVAAVLAEHEVTGLLEVTWTREETSRTRYVGPGRGGPGRPKKTEWTIRYQITAVRRNEPVIQERLLRMGWRVQVTNVPKERLSLVESVVAYRGGWSLERDFHLLKDRPLGIRPLYVRRDDQVVGLAHLVTLALRVLTLFEVLVRRGQEQAREQLPGLYPGQASRTTDRPTASRVLSAIARAGITATRVDDGDDRRWHLTPLPHLVNRVLAYLGLAETVYTRIAINSS
ncbi:MAG: transposase [Planctomycetaceae bacterium]